MNRHRQARRLQSKQARTLMLAVTLAASVSGSPGQAQTPETVHDFFTVSPCRVYDSRTPPIKDHGCYRPVTLLDEDGTPYQTTAHGCPNANGRCYCTWAEYPGGRIEARTMPVNMGPGTVQRPGWPQLSHELLEGLAYTVQLAGRCGVPASAVAVVANLTMINPGKRGNIRVADTIDRINDPAVQMNFFLSPAFDRWGNVVSNPSPGDFDAYAGPTRAWFRLLYLGTGDRGPSGSIVFAAVNAQLEQDGFDIALDVTGYFE